MAALSAGHGATDFANGALPALLPFFVDRFSLSYTLAAALILASAASSSLIQPLFGAWSDRRGALWLLPAGVAVAGIGIALAAAAPSYWLVCVLVVVSGLGVAAYHPEGSKFAAYASGRKRASGMSLFSVGGNLGFALGPTVTTPLVLAFGLTGGLLLAAPVLAVAAVLLLAVPYLASFAPEPSAVPLVGGQVVVARAERKRGRRHHQGIGQVGGRRLPRTGYRQGRRPVGAAPGMEIRCRPAPSRGRARSGCTASAPPTRRTAPLPRRSRRSRR